MRKWKFIIASILILIMSFTTYIYFKKQPVESIPKRATLVLQPIIIMSNEVQIDV